MEKMSSRRRPLAALAALVLPRVADALGGVVSSQQQALLVPGAEGSSSAHADAAPAAAALPAAVTLAHSDLVSAMSAATLEPMVSATQISEDTQSRMLRYVNDHAGFVAAVLTLLCLPIVIAIGCCM